MAFLHQLLGGSSYSFEDGYNISGNVTSVLASMNGDNVALHALNITISNSWYDFPKTIRIHKAGTEATLPLSFRGSNPFMGLKDGVEWEAYDFSSSPIPVVDQDGLCGCFVTWYNAVSSIEYKIHQLDYDLDGNVNRLAMDLRTVCHNGEGGPHSEGEHFRICHQRILYNTTTMLLSNLVDSFGPCPGMAKYNSSGYYHCPTTEPSYVSYTRLDQLDSPPEVFPSWHDGPSPLYNVTPNTSAFIRPFITNQGSRLAIVARKDKFKFFSLVIDTTTTIQEGTYSVDQQGHEIDSFTNTCPLFQNAIYSFDGTRSQKQPVAIFISENGGGGQCPNGTVTIHQIEYELLYRNWSAPRPIAKLAIDFDLQYKPEYYEPLLWRGTVRHNSNLPSFGSLPSKPPTTELPITSSPAVQPTLPITSTPTPIPNSSFSWLPSHPPTTQQTTTSSPTTVQPMLPITSTPTPIPNSSFSWLPSQPPTTELTTTSSPTTVQPTLKITSTPTPFPKSEPPKTELTTTSSPTNVQPTLPITSTPTPIPKSEAFAADFLFPIMPVLLPVVLLLTVG